MWNVGTLSRMLNGNATQIAGMVKVKQRVLIQIFSLGYFNPAQLNVQRVGVLKIFNLHGVNLRSKKAL